VADVTGQVHRSISIDGGQCRVNVVAIAIARDVLVRDAVDQRVAGVVLGGTKSPKLCVHGHEDRRCGHALPVGCMDQRERLRPQADSSIAGSCRRPVPSAACLIGGAAAPRHILNDRPSFASGPADHRQLQHRHHRVRISNAGSPPARAAMQRAG
jgi:hypothetical protein